MRCPDDGLLQSFIEGDLDPAATDLVGGHLASCERCRAAVARYKQLLWDLEHPAEPPLPPELEAMHDRLMLAWAQMQQEAAQATPSRRLVPAWAGYVVWTRYLPAVDRLGGFLSRTGRRLVVDRLPLVRYWVRWRR